MFKIYPICLGMLIVSLFLPIRFIEYGIVIRPFDIGLCLICMCCIFRRLAQGTFTIPKEFSDLISLGYCLLTFYIFLNAFYLSTVKISIISLIQNTEYFILMILIARLTTDPKRRDLFIKTLTICLIIISVCCAIYFISHGRIVHYKRFGVGPAKMTFGLASLLTFAYIFYVKKRKLEIFFSWWFPFACILMLLSLERKGWLGFIAGALIIILINRKMIINKCKKNSLFTSYLIVYGSILIISIAFIYNTVPKFKKTVISLTTPFIAIKLNDIDTSEKYARKDKHRLYILKYSLQSTESKPVFGIGLERFIDEIAKEDIKESWIQGPHNQYLEYMVETGLVGLGFYVLIWLLMFKRLIELISFSHPINIGYVSMIFALTIYCSVINLFLSSGALNKLLFVLPAGLVIGIFKKHIRLFRLKKCDQ